MSDNKSHWERVYATKRPEDVSWFRPHLDRSLAFLERSALDMNSSIVDVGGGASTLVDDLMERGFRCVTVLDVSASALEASKSRLGTMAAAVTWVEADVLEHAFPLESVDFWHDRAVFHFLRDEGERARYVAALTAALKPGGCVVLGTFALEGPERCSGLQVARYDAVSLLAALGDGFELIASAEESHQTPWSTAQAFVYVHARRRVRSVNL